MRCSFHPQTHRRSQQFRPSLFSCLLQPSDRLVSENKATCNISPLQSKREKQQKKPTKNTINHTEGSTYVVTLLQKSQHLTFQQLFQGKSPVCNLFLESSDAIFYIPLEWVSIYKSSFRLPLTGQEQQACKNLFILAYPQMEKNLLKNLYNKPLACSISMLSDTHFFPWSCVCFFVFFFNKFLYKLQELNFTEALKQWLSHTRTHSK